MTTRGTDCPRHNGMPRPPPIAAGLMIAASIALAAYAQLTGFDATPSPVEERAASLAIQFKDRPDGAIAVVKETTGETIKVIPPKSNGFIRGAVRGLARERKQLEMGSQAPFRLTLWQNGRLSLTDTATDARIFLEAYGPTNRNAFMKILKAGSE